MFANICFPCRQRTGPLGPCDDLLLAWDHGVGHHLGGRPTALWSPQVQTSDTSFGVRTNQFGFTITWAAA